MSGMRAGECPSVRVLVLNFNTGRDTVECIDSLVQMAYPNFSILILDNCSSDDSVSKIREAHPDIEFMKLARNAGYAAGNNVGIRQALDEHVAYVLVVNPDVTVDPDVLTRLVDAAVRRSRLGAISPIIRFKDEPHGVAFARGTIDCREALALVDTNDTPPLEGAIPTDWACGCCMLINSVALRNVGLIDESFFLYYEDVEFCQRLRRSDFEVLACTNATAYHRPHGSVQVNSPLSSYYSTRSAFQFFLRVCAINRVRRHALHAKLLRRVLINRPEALGLLRKDPCACARAWACVDYFLGRRGPVRRYTPVAD